MMKQQCLRYLRLILIVILVICLANVTGCIKQAPFIPKYIAPPDGDYIEITFTQVDNLLFSYDMEPEAVMETWQDKGIIVKDVKVDKFALSTLTENYIYFNNIKCIPRNFNDLLKLNEGDVIDVIGTFSDIPSSAGVNKGLIVLANCQFLIAGLYPLPLSGEGGSPGIMY